MVTTIDLMLENILYQEVTVMIVECASFWSGSKVGFYCSLFLDKKYVILTLQN